MQNLSANHLCFRCKAPLEQNRPFCGNCGIQQPQSVMLAQKKRGMKDSTMLIIIFSIVGLVGLLVGVTKLAEKQQTSVTNTDSTVLTKPTLTPTPTPEVTNAEKLKEAKNLIFDEATVAQLNAAQNLIRSIPKEAKEYKDAQKQSAIITDYLMDLALMGDRPTTAPARTYLRNNLNDYGSSEFIEWSSVLKTKIKNEPYWSLRLKLRAKNPVGAYLLKDVTFYIRQNQVVKTDGL